MNPNNCKKKVCAFLQLPNCSQAIKKLDQVLKTFDSNTNKGSRASNQPNCSSVSNKKSCARSVPIQ